MCEYVLGEDAIRRYCCVSELKATWVGILRAESLIVAPGIVWL